MTMKTTRRQPSEDSSEEGLHHAKCGCFKVGSSSPSAKHKFSETLHLNLQGFLATTLTQKIIHISFGPKHCVHPTLSLRTESIF